MARRQFRRLLACLSESGQHDGDWLDLFPIEADRLRLPALPADFPPDLLRFIQRQASVMQATPAAASSAVVAAVRRAYPPALGGVFPHCRKLASDILFQYVPHHPDLLQDGGAVLARLRPFGVEFTQQMVHKLALRWSPLWEVEAGLDALSPTVAVEGRPGPYRLVQELVEAGHAHGLPDLFRTRAYARFLQQMEDGSGYGLVSALAPVLPTLAADVFAHVLAVDAVGACINFRDLDDLSLLHHVVRSDRIRDLAPVVINHDRFSWEQLETDARGSDSGVGSGALSTADVTSTLLHHLPSRAEPVLDLFHVARTAPRLRQYLRRRRGLLVDQWAARLAQPDPKPFLQALCCDPEVAFVVVHVPSAGPTRATLMHLIVDRGQFDLVPVLAGVPGARFRQCDRDPYVPAQSGTTPIGRLAPRRLKAFVAHLPEPKPRALTKFYLPDLAQVLARAVQGGQFDVLRAVGRLLPQIVRVPITSDRGQETLIQFAERLGHHRSATYLLLVERRLHHQRLRFTDLGLAMCLLVCWATVS